MENFQPKIKIPEEQPLIPQIHPDQENKYSRLVAKIQSGNIEDGGNELYEIVRGFSRQYFLRRLTTSKERDDADDMVHNVFLVTLKAIQDEKLRDPNHLMEYITRVTKNILFERYRRNHAVVIEELGERDGDVKNLEKDLLRKEKIETIKKILKLLNPRYREVLERFYFEEQPKEKIMEEMKLSERKYINLKNHALARLTNLVNMQYYSINTTP